MHVESSCHLQDRCGGGVPLPPARWCDPLAVVMPGQSARIPASLRRSDIPRSTSPWVVLASAPGCAGFSTHPFYLCNPWVGPRPHRPARNLRLPVPSAGPRSSAGSAAAAALREPGGLCPQPSVGLSPGRCRACSGPVGGAVRAPVPAQRGLPGPPARQQTLPSLVYPGSWWVEIPRVLGLGVPWRGESRGSGSEEVQWMGSSVAVHSHTGISCHLSKLVRVESPSHPALTPGLCRPHP